MRWRSTSALALSTVVTAGTLLLTGTPASAATPTGPFRDALGAPLVLSGQFGSGQAIDPMVFTDDEVGGSSRSYLYWGQGATGSSPMGPWTRRGVVLQKRVEAGILGTGHHSVVRAPGTDTWYVAYHRFAVPAGNGTNRETAIDAMRFNADGTIAPITPTL